MICRYCKEDLPLSAFYRWRRGYSLHCKECRREYNRNYSRNKKPKPKNLPDEEGNLVCEKCNEKKSADSFGKHRLSGYLKTCKECNRKEREIQKWLDS